tara:strand:- start:763 stop:1248 length:486 start_codon:yes stop_codon:yes gene_type:complete
MPNNCNSIIKTFFYVLLITLVSSCASLDKKSSSNEYFGKLLISQDINDDKFSFNININLSKKDSIIQIKKPFYGNVLKIKVNEGKNLVFLPTRYSSPFYVPEEINRNFKYWLRQCLFSKNFYVDDVYEELIFTFSCENKEDKANFYINYGNVYINGFLLRK